MKNLWVQNLCSDPPYWLPKVGKEGLPLVAVSSRVRFARNVSGFNFPNHLNNAGRKEIFTLVSGALQADGNKDGWTIIPVSTLGDIDRELLLERRLLSRELCSSRTGAGVAVRKDLFASVLINEEDHLRIQILIPGADLELALKEAAELEKKLDRALGFSRDSVLGALTACPTNVGTGMRGSVMLHVPGLAMLDLINSTGNALGRLGFAMRGMFGEGTEAAGNFIQVSNQSTLGEDEKTIIRRLSTTVSDLIGYEAHARRKLLVRRRDELEDYVGRSYGTVCYARILSSSEALNCWSALWLGVESGLFSQLDRATLLNAFMPLQPGHLQWRLGTGVSPAERDRARADMVRQTLTSQRSRRSEGEQRDRQAPI